jgi:single-stranded-DNA-specific exonuclease
MKGVPEAVERLLHAVRHDEPIAVYGDFDADGVTSTVLMVQTLAALGARVRPYIPHRVDEGYGLHEQALKNLHDEGIRLVLTVDCGIRSVTEVAAGVANGLDMIVSDHHSVGSKLPPALAVINPRQDDCPYPFDGFAGVGVAFKLAQALLRSANGQTALSEEELLDLVALGTVADMMPLRGENRLLVRRGLEELNRGRRAGVRALSRSAGAPVGSIDATAIGFRLAPRLNAAGRLHTAALAYDLLATTDETEAEALAAELDKLNRERQRLTDEAVQWARIVLGETPAEEVILVAREGLNPGIVGLVASRLKDLHNRPALVAELGREEVRGSARSVPKFDITQALDKCDKDWFVRYGGHAAAAGFTVHHRFLPNLRQRLNELAAEQLGPEDRKRVLAIDRVLPLPEVDYALLGKLRELEPTGSGNPPPLFAIPDLLVRDARRVGGDGSHLKLRLSDGFVTVDAIGFGLGSLIGELPMRVDVACSLDENVWQGQRSLQLLVQDLQAAGRGVPTDSFLL